MFSTFKHLWLCVIGPRLYKIHGDGAYDKFYSPSSLEKWSDQVIQVLNFAWRISCYSTPLLGLYMYRQNYDVRTVMSIVKVVAALGVTSLSLRGCGRAANPQYNTFLRVLSASSNSGADPAALRKYDFDFASWPVDFDYRASARARGVKYDDTPVRRPTLGELPLFALGHAAIRTFGLKLIYPGSIKVLQMTIAQPLREGRSKLVEEHHGRRYKIRTADDNFIDCMFVDRKNQTANGHTLVITSEGNAGFYEIGIMSTPLEGGYSVLGWNHPGFGGSTGRPYPAQERAAVDAVMQFAIQKLGFLPENIVLFGWSIGCYVVAWAATQYPEVRGIVLDATFDDLLPLAVSRMPPSWGRLVVEVIRRYADLNIARVLKEYSGPVSLIRRTMDEIITVREGKLSTNRGNDLLIEILRHRYPDVCGPEQETLLRQYLGLQEPALSVFAAKTHPGDHDMNQKAIFLAGKYLTDYKSTHCTQLPLEYFHIPQDLTRDDDFVFVRNIKKAN